MLIVNKSLKRRRADLSPWRGSSVRLTGATGNAVGLLAVLHLTLLLGDLVQDGRFLPEFTCRKKKLSQITATAAAGTLRGRFLHFLRLTYS